LLPREENIVRRYGLAIREARARIDVKDDVAAVGRYLDRLCDEAVEREGLVERAPEQALVDVVAQAGCGDSADDEGCETVERTVLAEHDPSALGRVGVHIREMFEVGWQCGRAMHGNAMLRLRCKGASASYCCCHHREKQRTRPNPAAGTRQFRARGRI